MWYQCACERCPTPVSTEVMSERITAMSTHLISCEYDGAGMVLHIGVKEQPLGDWRNLPQLGYNISGAVDNSHSCFLSSSQADQLTEEQIAGEYYP